MAPSPERTTHQRLRREIIVSRECSPHCVKRPLRGPCQFVFQDLNINACARTTGCQLAVDHHCWNGSNAELLGAREDPGVRHFVHDDLERRTCLSPHYVNYLFAERASRAEYFHLALALHWRASRTKNNLKHGWSIRTLIRIKLD